MLDLAVTPFVWQTLPDMNEPRYAFGVAEYNKKLFAFGSYTSGTVEVCINESFNMSCETVIYALLRNMTFWEMSGPHFHFLFQANLAW